MKKSATAVSLFLASCLIFQSCSVSKDTITATPATQNNTGREISTCYVKFANGTIQQFKSLKLVTGVFTTPHLLADDTREIYAKDILAYQEGDHYAVSQHSFQSGHYSYVADDVLPGFILRVLKGKMNIYQKHYFNGRRTAHEFYVQYGEEGKIEAYSPKMLDMLLKNDPAAASLFHDLGTGADWEKNFLAAVSAYNSGNLVSRN